MASVYTTKRGKTKKAKLGIRKDNNNNQANKLNSKIKQDTKKVTTQPKELFKSQQELLLKQNGENFAKTLALAAKCYNSKCKTGKIDVSQKLSLCSACNSVQYCSRDCQVADWSNHKEKCLKIRQIKDEEAQKSFEFLNSQIDILSKEPIKEKKILDVSSIVIEDEPDIINLGKKSKESKENEINDTEIASTSTSTGSNSNVNWELFKNDDIPEIDEDDEDEYDDDEEDEE